MTDDHLELMTILKKGDRGKHENHRTITLITITSKILLDVLLERLHI